jgi:hypothetical protein
MTLAHHDTTTSPTRLPAERRARRRRALAHQCRQCRAHWALRLVEHPAGTVIACRFCGAVSGVLRARLRLVATG